MTDVGFLGAPRPSTQAQALVDDDLTDNGYVISAQLRASAPPAVLAAVTCGRAIGADAV